jgi:hypothetical protein
LRPVATIQVTCRAQGFRVADGNTWWYLIAFLTVEQRLVRLR